MLRQHTVEQLARVGGHSVGIVVLVVFVVGAVISMQIGPLLRDYGVVIMIADVAGIGFLRELGPMLTAVVLRDTPAVHRRGVGHHESGRGNRRPAGHGH